MQLPGYDPKDVEALFGKSQNRVEEEEKEGQKSAAKRDDDDGDPVKWLCR